MERKFTFISKWIIVLLTIAIATQFAVMGFMSQIKIDIYEKIYLFRTSPILMIGGMIACIAVILVICKFGDKIKLTPNRVFCISLAIALLWVMVSQNAPTDDADHCLKIADELIDGITHSFDAGQYMDVWRQQNFLVLYMCLLAKIGGMYNYVLFQVFNALGFAWMCREGYTFLCDKSGINNGNTQSRLANASFLIVLLFTPVWMSATYVYGNFLGMVFGIVALIYQYYYFKNSQKKYAILSALFIGLAIAFKMFFLIFLIAMLVMYVWNTIETKRFINIAWIVLCLICYIGFGKGADAGINRMSGGAVIPTGGVPMTASPVMGLDIYEDMTNPGWYTGYNINTYFAADCDKAATSETNKADLKKVIDRAKSDPIHYLSLLIKKNHTVWNDPTFDMLYRARLETDTQIEDHASWYNDLMADSGRLHQILLLFLQCMQVVIYVGVCLYCIYAIREKEYLDFIGLIAFVGGVLFITFWEAKSEYVLGYFLPLIVYATLGFDRASTKIMGFTKYTKTEKIAVCKNACRTFWPVLFVIIVSKLITLPLMPHNTDEIAWNEYLDNHTYISTGQYAMYTVSGCKPDTMQNIYVDFDPTYGSLWTYRIYDNSDRYYFIFQNWDEIDRHNFNRFYWDKEEGFILGNETVDDLKDYEWTDHWRISKRHGGYVISSIADGNKVWSYDEASGEVIVCDYEDGNPDQIWQFGHN